MITTIITDLDEVIRIFPSQRNDEYEKRLNLPKGTLLKQTFEHPDLDKVLKGEISDAEWRRKITFRIQKIAPLKDLVQSIKEWSSFPGIIYHEIMNLYLKYKERGIKLVLLSNATDKLKKDLDTHSIYDKFDLIINSSEIGKIKPNPDIF